MRNATVTTIAQPARLNNRWHSSGIEPLICDLVHQARARGMELLDINPVFEKTETIAASTATSSWQNRSRRHVSSYRRNS